MKAWRSVWGPTCLSMPARARHPSDDAAGAVPLEAPSVSAQEDGPVGAFADGEVDGSASSVLLQLLDPALEGRLRGVGLRASA